MYKASMARKHWKRSASATGWENSFA